MMTVTLLPAKSNVPAALLRDGDVIRWLDNVAVVRVNTAAEMDEAGRVYVRQIPQQNAVLGYTNRLHTWDELQTPVFEVWPHEQVEVLLARY